MTVTDTPDLLTAEDELVVSLAEAVSLGVRVEPELLRRARLELVPTANASTEADLWFSSLVEAPSATAFMLRADVAERLRRRLGHDRARLEEAWRITSEVHAKAPPAIALEEEVNYLLLAEGPDSPQLQHLLERAVVALVQGGPERAGVARWAVRALSRLPAAVAGSEAGLMLTVAARSRLGRSDVLPEGVTPETEWLPWVLPSGLERVDVGVRLFADGLQIGPPDPELGHIVSLPRTDPLLLHVSWREGADERRRKLRLRPDEDVTIRIARPPPELDGPTFTLETAWGEAYTIRPQTAPVPIRITAHSDGRGALVVWRPEARIDRCLGFALQRRRRDGTVEVLPNRIGFEPQRQPSPQPSTVSPFQRLTWHDPGLGTAELTEYRVVPMLGLPGNLREGTGSEWTDPVAASPSMEPGFTVTFNRGILGLASLAARQSTGPSPLLELIATVGSEVREYLGGDLRAELMSFLERVVHGGGTLYAALSELSDPEVLKHLVALGSRAHVLLAPPARSTYDRNDRNAIAAKDLTFAGVDVQRAPVRGSALFHHRFAVACDGHDIPERVWIGGANWTSISLCVQASDATIVDDPAVASLFLDAWKSAAAGSPPGRPLRSPKVSVGSVDMTIWFSPAPGFFDLEGVFGRVASARQGVLFAVANSSGSTELARQLAGRPAVYVRGMGQPGGTASTLFQDGQTTRLQARLGIPKLWSKELSRFTNYLPPAVLAIDPLSARSAVVTGSHGLSRAASNRNAETLLMVENAPALAAAYAVRINTICDHFAALRAAISAGSDRPLTLRRADSWQDRFQSEERQRELAFWLGSRS
jgi:hypothetical protein